MWQLSSLVSWYFQKCERTRRWRSTQLWQILRKSWRMASLWTSKTQSGRNNCGKDSCVLNVQYGCENVGLYIFCLLIRFWCVLITTGIVYTHRINVLFLVICLCTLGIKYCHHYILFLSLCKHVFDAFSCKIHHEERYLKFPDISFENINTARKYRNNIDTFLQRYPSPNGHCWTTSQSADCSWTYSIIFTCFITNRMQIMQLCKPMAVLMCTSKDSCSTSLFTHIQYNN